ncbi:MAG: acyl-CoA dehydrogenase family protein [Ilumatobacteraceae bacterium]
MAVDRLVRGELRSWLAEHWDPERSLVEWRRSLLATGWAAPTWPVEWCGRGLPSWADALVADELSHAGAVGAAVGSGMTLAAPTLLAHGSDDLKRRLLPPTVTGEATWCQLFSEPSNGSDLAGLITRAELDGDEWVINGQKVWSTSAHHAHHGMLLARTDREVPKHAGITYFVLPMNQPGVEVRPLRQMNGHASFNEVFLTDARVPSTNVVGQPGDGWAAALTTLAHERGFATLRRRRFDRRAGRAVGEAADEADAYFATYAWYPQRAGRADLLAERAAGRDALARQSVAAVVAMSRAHDWTARRAQAARTAGRPPGAEGSLGKLAASEVARAAAAAHGRLAGARGTLLDGDEPLDAVVAEVLTSVPAQSIAGGTDEIQRNIIGERVLGLAREPRERPPASR